MKLDPSGPLVWSRASSPLACSSNAVGWGFLDPPATLSNVPLGHQGPDVGGEGGSEHWPAARPRSQSISTGERSWFPSGKCTSIGWATSWKAALWGRTLGSHWAPAELEPGLCVLTTEATSDPSCTRQNAASRAGKGGTGRGTCHCVLSSWAHPGKAWTCRGESSKGP